MSISQFQTFRELLLYCLKCHDSGDSQQALALIDEYLSDSRANRPPESFWSDYNVQQALGFRVSFMEKMDPSTGAAAEARHLDFCRHAVQYWGSAAADSSARLAITRFGAGDVAGGREAAGEAARLAVVVGHISATVAKAAEQAREDAK